MAAWKKTIIYSLMYAFTALVVFSIFLSEPKEADYPALRLILNVFVSMLLFKYIKSFIYMVIAPWYALVKAKRERLYPSDKYKPLVSVIIPAFNEEVGLLNTVQSIIASEYKNIEIIVVNDGSTDGSDKMMRTFIARQSIFNGIRLKYLYKENGGKGKALNYGIERSKGDIIVSIDADCALTPQTIGNFVKPFADPKIMAAVGNVKIGKTDTIVETVQSLEFLFSFYFKRAESVLGAVYIIGGAAGAFRRQVFEVLGPYDTTNITEDIDLSVRVQKAGMGIVYVDDAIVYTEGANKLLPLAKQRTRWRRGWFQTLSNNKGIMFNRKQNKFLAFYLIPFGYVGNFQLTFEPWFMVFVFVYSCITGDFTSYITWIGIEATMVLLMAIFERERSLRFLSLGPILWLLFFITTYVEYHSLVATIRCILTKKELKWQRWQRTGCLSPSPVTQSTLSGRVPAI